MKTKYTDARILLAGALTGFAALLLSFLGNPANMGFCIACFLRDIAGALGLHRADKVQYLRPEIIGLVIGAFGTAIATKEFKPKAGSSPATRFVLGMILVIGALIFLGCPLRMVLRLAGGDFNAITGLVGYIIGIYIGTIFLNKGFSLKRSYDVGKTDGYVLPAAMALLLVLLLVIPSIFIFSQEGPGSKHAPLLIALLISLAVGVLSQRARLCTVGGIRDFIMFKDTRLLSGSAMILVLVLVGNIILQKFKPGFALQPISHSSHVWNLLGMVLVGWASVLLGGCPFRQLILAGEGNGDSAVTVAGMIAGAAFAHNFKLAAAPDSLNEAKELVVGGLSANGKAAAFICLAVLIAISLINLPKEAK